VCVVLLVVQVDQFIFLSITVTLAAYYVALVSISIASRYSHTFII